MLYTLIGFGVAALFGMAAHAMLGFPGLLASPWVDPVFWGIIATGLVLDHQASFRDWFRRQPALRQNLVAAGGFLGVGLGLVQLLGETAWTWHIPG
jgi:hypothetical protein